MDIHFYHVTPKIVSFSMCKYSVALIINAVFLSLPHVVVSTDSPG